MLDAILEVRSSVAYATLAVLLMFLPVLALTGVAGRLFGPLALAYVAAVVASLLVALTVTPALSLILLGDKADEPAPPPIRPPYAGHGFYLRLLDRAGRAPRLVMAAGLAATLAGAALLPGLGLSFLPDLREGHLILHMVAAPGTSLTESQRLGTLITAELKGIPGVRAVASQIGRPRRARTRPGALQRDPYRSRTRPRRGGTAERRREDPRADRRFPGPAFSLKSFLTERIEEVISGFTAPVVVNVVGNDLDRIEAAARAVARELAEVRGARDVQQAAPAGLPQLTVALRQVDLRHWGIDAVDVLETVRTAYQGDVVGQTYRGNAVFNVIVLLDGRSRDRLSLVGNLPLRTPAGRYLRLSQVADVYESTGRYQVQHQVRSECRRSPPMLSGGTWQLRRGGQAQDRQGGATADGRLRHLRGSGRSAGARPARSAVPHRARGVRHRGAAGGGHRLGGEPRPRAREPPLRLRRRGSRRWR